MDSTKESGQHHMYSNPTHLLSKLNDKLPIEKTSPKIKMDQEKIRIEPYKYLVFEFNKHSEEWLAAVVIWNHDNTNNYTFSIKYNRNSMNGPFIIRPRCKGLLPKRAGGFGKKMTIQVIYDAAHDEPYSNYQEQEIIDMKTLNQDGNMDSQDTKKYFRLDILRMEASGFKTAVCREYFIPIFEFNLCSNYDVLVYPQKSLTFNRNEGNQFSYWTNNFFIINNTSQTVYFKILATKLPPGSDMVIFPSKGVINYSFSENAVTTAEDVLLADDDDKDSAKKFYRIINLLVLQPHKKYAWNSVQKSMTTLVIFFSYHKWPDNDKLDSLRRWANFLETIDIYVNDVTDNVIVKENNVEHLHLLLNYAKHTSLNPFTLRGHSGGGGISENFATGSKIGRRTVQSSVSFHNGPSRYASTAANRVSMSMHMLDGETRNDRKRTTSVFDDTLNFNSVDSMSKMSSTNNASTTNTATEFTVSSNNTAIRSKEIVKDNVSQSRALRKEEMNKNPSEHFKQQMRQKRKQKKAEPFILHKIELLGKHDFSETMSLKDDDNTFACLNRQMRRLPKTLSKLNLCQNRQPVVTSPSTDYNQDTSNVTMRFDDWQTTNMNSIVDTLSQAGYSVTENEDSVTDDQMRQSILDEKLQECRLKLFQNAILNYANKANELKETHQVESEDGT